MSFERFCFVDIECDGLRKEGYLEFPTQICMIATNKHGKVIETYNKFIKGARYLSPWVIKNCRNISLDILNKEGIPIQEAMAKIMSYVSHDTLFVMHNVKFDWNVIESQAPKSTKLQLQHQPRFCTMEAATNFTKIPKTGYSSRYPGWKWPSLVELANALGQKIPSTLHDAENDTILLKRCYFEGKKRNWW